MKHPASDDAAPGAGRVAPEQVLYARWLDWGTRAALALLVATFVAYATGVIAPRIGFEQLAQVWGLPLAQYRAATGTPDGWGWLALAGHGDFLNLVSIALIGLVTPICYVRMLAPLLRRGERAFALIAVGEIIVLAAASAGWIGAGH